MFYLLSEPLKQQLFVAYDSTRWESQVRLCGMWQAVEPLEAIPIPMVSTEISNQIKSLGIFKPRYINHIYNGYVRYIYIVRYLNYL